MENEIELTLTKIDFEREKIIYVRHTLLFPANESFNLHRQSIKCDERFLGKETFDRVQKFVADILTEHLKVSESKLKDLLNL